jgi:hypothetical protein
MSVDIASLRQIAPVGWADRTLTGPTGVQTEVLIVASAILGLVLCAVFFAVVAGVLRYRNRRKEREWLAREAKWEGPLLEVLAGIDRPERLWSLVTRGDELYFVDYLLRYARRIRGSTRRVLAELARPYLGPVADRMSTGDTERRARAVETIAMLDFDRHAERIVAALDDESPLVSMIAARSIARNQRREHVPVLLAHIARLAAWSPRQLTALLTTLGGDAAPALREALADRAHAPELRAIAADALRRLHDPEAVDVAADLLSVEENRELLAAALRIVAALGRPEHAAQVRPLCTHEDPVIRAVAIQALTTTGAAEDLFLLRLGLDDESHWVAIHAARALRDSGGGASLRVLARSESPRSALAQQVLMERLG